MSLKSQVTEILDDLRSGERIDRAALIAVLAAVTTNLPETTPSLNITPKDPKDGEFHPKENTPVRFPAKNWGQFSPCKRCGKHDVPDGDLIVRIKGTGWWHDYCYFCINPDFYKGIEPPKPPKG
jgi:hypothetical protein